MKVEGGNAIQILLLLGGITLVPALLFTVTGFSRILIVLGFIRSGLGTPTAPPNQVLVGIALFLTLFVMQPTFAQVKKQAWDPLQKGKITQVQALDRAQGPMREFMFRQTRTKDIALFAGMATLKARFIACVARLMTTSVLIRGSSARAIGSPGPSRPRGRTAGS